MAVVCGAAVVVMAGNLSENKDQEGFLLGYLKKEVNNKEKIVSRVMSHNKQSNLLTAPLAMASSLNENESIEASMFSQEELMANQMQRQVVTATAPDDAKKLLDEGADVVVYQVKEGDSVSSIAENFNITVNTILWANDIENADMIKPGDKIFILPVAGVKHVVKKGDTVKKIAEEYEADKEEVIAFNELPADGSVDEGDELIIPGGEKEAPEALKQRSYYSSGVAGAGRAPSIIDRNPAGGHRFPYGQCTYYVAQHKYVPWGGNAGTWLYNARAYGVKTGKTPKVGSIIVTSESWYGHVGIVEAVSGNSVTISEMNYKGIGVTNRRTLNANNPLIKGYIY
ncbi:MAG: LysM peptidoglycan-binding domain-containing protein [Candidatus Moranbacteria bacterium]|nr:LysM peptidoglycan-binding domain-containing protein [Candidatus Moranbacteria bacterium]